LIAQTQTVNHIRGEVLDGNIAHRDNLLGDLRTLGLGDIELYAALSLVVLVEVAGAVDSRLAVRPRREHAQRADSPHRLHADDFSAHVGQLHRARWPGPDPGEVGDADPFKRAGHYATFAPFSDLISCVDRPS